MRLNLKQIFGENCISDENVIVIKKLDLRITPDVNNQAEQILAAIVDRFIKNFQGFVTTPSGEILVDEDNQPISYDNSALYEAGGLLWRRQSINQKYLHTFVLELDKF